jgi:hypothetical protein
MKEKMWTLIGGIFAAGTVAAVLMGILPPGDFKDLALIAVMAIFNEARLSSNNKSWTEWGEQQKAEFAALVKAATENKNVTP